MRNAYIKFRAAYHHLTIATGDRFASRSLRPDANPEQKLVLTAVEGEPSHLWASHLAKPVTEAKGA